MAILWGHTPLTAHSALPCPADDLGCARSPRTIPFTSKLALVQLSYFRPIEQQQTRAGRSGRILQRGEKADFKFPFGCSSKLVLPADSCQRKRPIGTAKMSSDRRSDNLHVHTAISLTGTQINAAFNGKLTVK